MKLERKIIEDGITELLLEDGIRDPIEPEAMVTWGKRVIDLAKKRGFRGIKLRTESRFDEDDHRSIFLVAYGTRRETKNEALNRKQREQMMLLSEYDGIQARLKFFQSKEGRRQLNECRQTLRELQFSKGGEIKGCR